MANRYWVGGSGTWDATTTTNWSATSGGAGGASAPTSTDDVFINTSSGTGLITCTAAICNNLTVTAIQGIILGNAGGVLTIYGSVSLPSGGTFAIANNNTFVIYFASTTTGNTITSGTQGFSNIVFDGVGGEWSLVDNLSTYGSATGISLNNGSFNANNKNVQTSYFRSSNSNVRTLTMGSGLWTLTSTNTSPIWSTAINTNLTFNKDTANILVTATNTNTEFRTGGLSFNKLTHGNNSVYHTLVISNGGSFTEIESTKTTSSNIQFEIGTTTTVGLFTTVASSKLLKLSSNTLGTKATLSTSATVNSVNIQDLDLASASTGTATNSNVINSSNWNVATTSKRWLSALTSGTSVTTPSDWPSSATTEIHMIGGGGGGAGNVTTSVAGGAGGGGGGYVKIPNIALAPSTSYSYTIGSGGSGAAGSITSSIGGAGGNTTWGSASNSVTFVASSSANNAANATLTINKPTGTAVGDLMLAHIVGGNNSYTWTVPTGWNKLTSNANTGRTVYYKYASSSEGSSYTWTQGGGTAHGGQIVTYRNALLDAYGELSSNASPSVATAITTSANNALVLDFVNSGVSIGPTTPTGFTLVTSLTTNVWSYIYSKTQATAGTTGTVSTTTTASARSMLVSLIPNLYTYVATGGKGGISTSVPNSTIGGGGGGIGNSSSLVYMGGYSGLGDIAGATYRAGGGGGGAAGPNGNGGNGGAGVGASVSNNAAGGGGGGNGGGTSGADATGVTSAGIGGAGGNNFLGTGGAGSDTGANGTLGGGGGGAAAAGNSGGGGGNGIDIVDGLYGGGGGAGGYGTNSNTGSTGGLYGGGGAGKGTGGGTAQFGTNGGQGIILVGYTGTYTPPVAGGSTGNMFLMFY